jgi:prepilin-type N-terminal cleavage/methylation domain-containing protein
MTSTHLLRRRAAGFTLMELMVVIAIMALLASLTLMAFRHAQTTAMRNRTTAFHRSLMSGLENYHSEFGEYPQPKNPAKTSEFSQKTYTVGAALMLYQAMSGDGDTEINIASGSLGASTGRLTDLEISRVMLKEMPTEMWKRDTTGYLIVDGFGHPFQYAVPDPATKARYGAATTQVSPDTVNTTYDLWSYGEDSTNTAQTSLAARRSDQTSAQWIKNW